MTVTMAHLPRHQLAAYGLFFLIAAAYLTMALCYPIAYIWATYEDLVGEWVQWYGFLFAFFLSGMLAYSATRYRPFFAFLTLACLYVLLEEISWGQRIIGFSSPEFFVDNNLQKETNLHNFLVGPYDTLIKDTIEYTLACSLIVFGLIYPLAIKLNWKPSLWLRRWVPAPPLYLWPFFVSAACLEVGLFKFNEAEIAELLVAVALVIMLLHYRIVETEDLVDTGGPARRIQHKRLGLVAISLFALMLVLATGTTYAVYSIPHVQEKTDARIQSGIKKFASRYARYENWPIAVELYERAHKHRPDNAKLLRKLAWAYLQMGDAERFEYMANKAIAWDAAKLAQRKQSVSLNLSLARSYELIDETDKVEKHLAAALHVAQQRVRDNPQSASAKYWLGNTYKQHGEIGEAARLYKQAHEMKPSSSKYRKAYYKYRKKIGDS